MKTMFDSVCLCLICIGLVFDVAAQEKVYINCGGDSVDQWSADWGCNVGDAATSTATIKKTGSVPMAVYQSCRIGPRLTYNLADLPDGRYQVRFHFAELVYTKPGQRIFTLRMEGVKAESKLDILARAGKKNKALRLTYHVKVADGNGLQIKAIGKNGADAAINGIEITPLLDEVALSRIDIIGPDIIMEYSEAPYTCRATYSDGTTADATRLTDWSENSPFAAINSVGVLTATAVSVNQTCRITTAYEGKSAFLDVTIKAIPAPESMVLISAGRNRGTDPDFGFYDLRVDAYYIDMTEVTKAQWDEVRNWGSTHGYTDLQPGVAKGANHPQLWAGMLDVLKWCNARSEMEGRKPAYYTSSDWSTVFRTGNILPGDDCVDWENGYRLPTKEEWEYAARGGLVGKRFPWGDTISHVQANYYSSSILFYDVSPTRGLHPDYGDNLMPDSEFDTNPVRAFPANGYGLFGMAGNADEMVWGYEWIMGFLKPLTCGGSGDMQASYARCGSSIVMFTDTPSTSFRPILPAN